MGYNEAKEDKMRRKDFTPRVALLIQYVYIICDYNPILDYVKRSDHEQAWLFKKGLSDCDGKRKKSRHQFGKGFDLYLEKEGKLVWDRKVYYRLHKFWEFLGGLGVIKRDLGHFGG